MKTISATQGTTDSHTEILQLLPWYVKRTLSAQDAGRVESHLKSCSQCQSEFLHCQAFAQQIPSDTKSWTPSSSHFNTILARVDAYETELKPEVTRDITIKQNLRSKIFQWFTQAPTPMQWIVGLETAACVGLLLFIVSPVFHQLRSDGLFQTLSTTESTVKTDGIQLRLLFADDMTTKEINSLLKQAQAQIRQGPSAVGSYTVEVTKQSADKALSILRSNPKVKLAQPIAQASQE